MKTIKTTIARVITAVARAMATTKKVMGGNDYVTRAEFLQAIDTLNEKITAGFTAINQRFQLIDAKFEQIDQRLQRITETLDRINLRFTDFETAATHPVKSQKTKTKGATSNGISSATLTAVCQKLNL